MTKSQLVAAVAARTGLPESEAARVMETAEESLFWRRCAGVKK